MAGYVYTDARGVKYWYDPVSKTFSRLPDAPAPITPTTPKKTSQSKPRSQAQPKPRAAQARQRTRSESDKRRAEIEAKAAREAAAEAEVKADAKSINEAWQAEALARQQGEVATQARFEQQARESAKEAAAYARARRRRLRRLRAEGAEGAQIDRVAAEVRAARKEADARRLAYESIARRAQLARTRLEQVVRANARPGSAVGPPTHLAKPWEVLGQTQEGKVDPSLKRKAILDEIKDIRRQQGEQGGLVDQGRLRVLDQRVTWVVESLAASLDPLFRRLAPLEERAKAGDVKAARKILRILDEPETQSLLRAKERWFGKGPEGVGDFHRYFDHRRVISTRHYEYWVGKFQTQAENQWHAGLAQARAQGLARRNLVSAGVVPWQDEDTARLKSVVPEAVGLQPDGNWSEAPPEQVARAIANMVKERASNMPDVRLFLNFKGAQDKRFEDLDAYAHAAAEKAGLPFEGWQMTQDAVLDDVVEATVAQFRADYEAKHGPVDTGFDLFGQVIVFGSDEDKKRSEDYRAEEAALRNSLHQLYRDKNAPGLIEELLGGAVQTIALPAMQMIGAAWGGFWADMQGYGPTGPSETQKPFTATQLSQVRSKEDLVALGVEGNTLRRFPDDFDASRYSPEQIQQLADELNQVYGLGKVVGPGLNLLNPNTWLGGPSNEDIEAWLRKVDMDPRMFYNEEGRFSKRQFETYLRENPDFHRQYVRDNPSAQGLIVPAHLQANAPDDFKFAPKDGFSSALGFGYDIGQSGLEERYSEQETFRDEFGTPAPGEDAIATFWRQIRMLNEVPNQLQREPGGGALNPVFLGSLLADPAMLAKPGRVARIVQYALATGDGFGGKTSVLVRQLWEHSFGFSIPGRGHLGIPQLNGKVDVVGRWADARRMVKDVRKAYVDGAPLSEREFMALFEDFAVREGFDPIKHGVDKASMKAMLDGFLAEVERIVGPRRISHKQVQSASERYLRRALAREGVQLIERADQTRLRSRAEKLVAEADAADAKAAASAAAETAEARARKAARDASAKRQGGQRGTRKSVFEAGDDFVDHVDDALGRAPGDFRAPRAHQIVGGYAVRYYRRGLTKARDSASVYAVGTARHAQDIIALADSIARRYGLGVRWVRNPSGIPRAHSGRGIAELFGGTREQMAQAADELDTLMRKHRLGSRTRGGNLPYRQLDPSDGRVLFRDRFADEALDEFSRTGDRRGINPDRLMEKGRLRRSQLRRLEQIKNKELTPRLRAAMDRIKALDEAAAKGDQAAQAEQARLFKQASEVESQIARIEQLHGRISDRRHQLMSDARAGYSGPLGVARVEALLAGLGADKNWLRSQLRITKLRLKAAPNDRHLLSYLEWLEQAALGVRLLAEDVGGPVAVARRLVKDYGDQATFLQPASAVAPILPSTPPAGMTQRAYGLMEIGRSLRARLARSVAVRLESSEGMRAVRQWQAEVARSRFNRLKLDEFGLELDGIDEVMPVLRALESMDVYAFEHHRRINAFLKLQVRYAERSGAINWTQVGRDLGMETGTDLEKVEALMRLRAQEMGEGLSVSYADFKKLDEAVTEAVRKATGGVDKPFVRGRGPKRTYDEAADVGGGAPYVGRDYDLAIVSAKARALKGTGWTVDLYDEARTVLQDAFVRERRMDDLAQRAAKRAAVTGESLEAAMTAERKIMARKLSDEKLRRWAMESPYGLSEEEVWDDFVRSVQDEQLQPPGGTLSLTPFQQRMALNAVADLVGVPLRGRGVALPRPLPEVPPGVDPGVVVSMVDAETAFGGQALYHGTRVEPWRMMAASDGTLYLHDNINYGSTPGISFGTSMEVATDYATRNPGQGSVRTAGRWVIVLDPAAVRREAARLGDEGDLVRVDDAEEMIHTSRAREADRLAQLEELADEDDVLSEFDEINEALFGDGAEVTGSATAHFAPGEYKLVQVGRAGDDLSALTSTPTSFTDGGAGYQHLRALEVGHIDPLRPGASLLNDNEWAKVVAPIAPSKTFAADARKFLVDMGHWSPRTADDIREGKRVWSAREEAAYYLDNWGFRPDWTDTQELIRRGAFDSEFMYAKIMTELGVWDNTVDIELRLSGLDAESQRLRVLWGDEAKGIKVLRSIEDQRRWMAARWEGAVFRQPTRRYPRGYFTRAPWLMDPTTAEYRRYLSDQVTRYVEDVTLLPAEEARELGRVILKRMQFNLRQLQEAAAAGDGAVLEQTFLEQAIRLTDDLAANPRWRPLFAPRKGILARGNAANVLLSGLGYVQRLNVITQFAFGFINAFEVSRLGMKNWLARIYTRSHGGVGLSDVPQFVHERFPTVESTGLGSGTTIWERTGSGNAGRALEALDRLKDPASRGLDDVKDLLIGGLKSIPEAGLVVSARAEQALKLQMFKRLYTDRFGMLMREGYAEAQADLLARAQTVSLVNAFFPNMEGRSWWFKALNEVVPFLHYNWATTTLYAKEFLAHPWIIPKMEALGTELERVNRERWEQEHPGLPYPRGEDAHKLNITVGGETFVIDFLGLSDVARGSRLLVKLTSGEEMSLYEFIRQFIRIPHPWQANLYAYLMGEPSWYTGRKVELGEVVWPAGVVQWYHDSIEDGTIGTADWFRLASRMAFFSEARALNPLQATEQAYFALRTDDARRKFLAAHPELREYWAAKEPSAVKVILQNHGVLPTSYWQTLSVEEAKGLERSLANYRALRDDWDQKLQAYLDAGGSPLDEGYKALKEERFESLSDARAKDVFLYNYDMHYNDPLDWSAEVAADYRDSLYETWAGFDEWMPQRRDYPNDVAYQKALRDFYDLKGEWLEAHPELFATLGRERTQLELAVADVYQQMGEIYDDIGQRNLAIARAEAKGQDVVVEALHGINELRYSQLDDPHVVFLEREPPLEIQQAVDMGRAPADIERALVGPDDAAAVVVIPGATVQKYRNATPEERKQMRRDFWYREAIERVFETSDSGAEFLQALDRKPALKAEYLARLKQDDPEAYQHFVDREYYHNKLDNVMALIERTGDWSHWWKLLESDARFRNFYIKTHPEKYTGRFDSNMRQFKKLGKVVARAEQTGDWSVFWAALRKDKGLREWWLSMEPGRKRRWEEEATYLAKLQPVVKRAVKTGDWSEFNRLLRSDEKFRESFFERNPEKRQTWLRDEAYRAAIARYARVAKQNPEKAVDYFASLPDWVQKRYYAQASEGGKMSAAGNAYTRAMSTWAGMFDREGPAAAMRYFNSLPAWIRERYFSTHPGQREKFAQNDAYGKSMRTWIRFFEKEDYDGAEKYFNSLPLWMRQRYFSNNPDKRPGPNWTYPVPDWKLDEKYAKLLGRFYQADPAEKAAILRDNPAFRRYFRETGKGPERHKSMVLAAYAALPEDPWLRRVFRERFPEVFSEEAKAEERYDRLRDKLRDAGAGFRPRYLEALDYLTKTYLGSVQGYGVPPKPMEVERLNEEKLAQRRRREALRHKGIPEWDIWKEVPREVPGLENVLRGVA